MSLATANWTTAAVSATGSLESNLALPGGVSSFFLLKIRITPSAAGGLSTYELYADDTFAGDMLWKAGPNALSPFYDPVLKDADDNISQEHHGLVCYYEDEDASDEFHIKIYNAAAVERTYYVEIWYTTT